VGRFVIAGEEPLLEAVFGTNGVSAVILYGRPGPDYTVGSQTELDPAGAWQPVWQGPLDDVFRELPMAVPAEGAVFLRAWR